MLHQLGRGTTPNVEVTFGKLFKAKSASLFTGSLEACGVTDQAEHGQPQRMSRTLHLATTRLAGGFSRSMQQLPFWRSPWK